LPVLGRDGTLWDTNVNSPAAGHIEAKTGTYAELDKLHRDLIIAGKGLVGYVHTARGRDIAFAIYVNNVRAPHDFKQVSKIGDALAEIATALYEFE
jgi:D-alanyl-D-alanine carboxypeptidase